MKKIAIIALVIVGAVLSLAIYFESGADLRRREALWRERAAQLAALNAEHQRLSDLVANATNASREDHSVELAKLRRAAESLKAQTNGIGGQLSAGKQSRPRPLSNYGESHPPEYWDQLHKTAGGRSKEAGIVTSRFCEYAHDHQGQFPASLDQLAPYLAKARETLSGTNQFEIVYQGSINELDGINSETVAVIRTQDTWPGPDGRATRVYGMADGATMVLSSDDNFQSWEAQHIVPSAGAGQIGK